MNERKRPTDSIHPRGIVPPYVLEQIEQHQEAINTDLANLALYKANAEQDAADDMINEGGPANDNEQGDNDE